MTAESTAWERAPALTIGVEKADVDRVLDGGHREPGILVNVCVQERDLKR